MKKTGTTLCVALFCVLPFAVQARDNYQYEGAISYSSTDDEDFLDTTTFGASVTMFIEPVSYDGRPYNETGFLARKSNVTLALGQVEYEINSVDIDATAFGASAEYVFPENRFVLGAGFTTADGDRNYFGSDIDVSLQDVAVSAGYYPDPLSRARLVVANSELEFTVSTGGGGTLDSDTVLVDYVSVYKMDNGKYSSIRAGYARIEFEDIDIDAVQFGGDYYFSRTTSVGGTLGYVTSDEDGAEGDSVALRFKHFVDRFTSFEFEFEQFNGDGSNGDSDTTFFRVLHRY